MPKLQCPKCKQPIEIKSLPADNRVKCGSCSAEFALKSKESAAKPTPTAAAKVATVSSKPANPATSTKPAGSTTSAAATKSAPASKASATSTAAVDPNDPFANLDLNTLGKPKRVDLGVAPIPTGVAESPTADKAPWLAGNQPAYAPLSEAEAQALANPYQADKPKKTRPTPKKMSLGTTIAVISILVLMAGGSIVAAVIVASR